MQTENDLNETFQYQQNTNTQNTNSIALKSNFLKNAFSLFTDQLAGVRADKLSSKQKLGKTVPASVSMNSQYRPYCSASTSMPVNITNELALSAGPHCGYQNAADSEVSI